MRSASSSSGGTRNGIPRARRSCAARAAGARAIVGSGTRNARAVCAVLRPPSDFTVSATRAGSASDGMAAGEEQPQAVVGEGGVVVHASASWAGADAGAVALGERLERAEPLVERARAAQRGRSPAALAVVVSQAAGTSGTPSRGHVASATA